jgi:hypothetical protein
VYITRNRVDIVNLEIKRKASLMPHEPGHYDIEPMDFGFSTDELSALIGEGVQRWGDMSEGGETQVTTEERTFRTAARGDLRTLACHGQRRPCAITVTSGADFWDVGLG